MFKYFLFLLLLVLSSFNVSATTSDNINSPLGINTNEAMDIGTSIPFVDLFKLSLPFNEARPWLTKGNVVYDDNGWPKLLNKGMAGTRFVSNIPAETLPVGNYTVLYDGDGQIEYGVAAKLLKHTQGKDLISLKPDNKGLISATITIIQSDPKNYIRNIRILMPGGICSGKNYFIG